MNLLLIACHLVFAAKCITIQILTLRICLSCEPVLVFELKDSALTLGKNLTRAPRVIEPMPSELERKVRKLPIILLDVPSHFVFDTIFLLVEWSHSNSYFDRLKFLRFHLFQIIHNLLKN